MLHSLDSSLPSFRRIEFKPGVNIILAEGNLQRDKKGTANSVGKSSVFRLVDYLLGGKLEDKELPQDRFGAYSFELEATIKDRRVKISRSADSKEGKYVTVTGPIDGWPYVTEEEVHSEKDSRKFDIKRWQSILGACCFDLPNVGPDGTPASNKAPTAREMFNVFNRKSFNDINKAFPRQGAEKGKLVTAYLLGLNWEYLVRLAAFRKEEKLVKSIEDTAKFELSKRRVTKAKLQREREKLQSKIDEAEKAMGQFQVDLSYAAIEAQVDELTERLRQAQRRASNAKRKIDLAEKAKVSAVDSPDELEAFYGAVRISLGDMVKRHLSEVKNFHERVQHNRLSILNAEIAEQSKVYKAAIAEAEMCDQDRASLVKGIDGQSTALDDFRDKQNALAELKSQLDRNSRSIHLFEEAETEQNRINESRDLCATEEKDRFAELSRRTERLSSQFHELVESMYSGADGRLSIEFQDGTKVIGKKKPYDIVVKAKVAGDNGSGKAHMKVCAFDLLAFGHTKDLGRGIDFLMHDTPAFEASDINQIGHVIVRADKIMRERSGQYVCAIDKNRFDRCCAENKEFALMSQKANMIHLSESSKLFGMDFD